VGFVALRKSIVYFNKTDQILEAYPNQFE